MTQIEQIKAEIERLKSQLVRGACASQIAMETNCKEEAYNEVLAFIDSLPVTYLQQEHPEVDLEKEIVACWQNWLSPSNQKEVEGVLPKTEFATYARHFFELGLNARNDGPGVELIAAERKRQIREEGWTKEHDAEHTNDALALAAACYAIPSVLRHYTYMYDCNARIPDFWPWDIQSWKPSPDNRVKELVKAGALIAAEIDRLNAKKNESK